MQATDTTTTNAGPLDPGAERAASASFKLLLGVNLAGGEFGSTTGNQYGTDYTYPSHAEIDHYAAKGMDLIRLPFLWERIQPTIDGTLSPTDLALLDDVVNYATAKGLKVDLDMHDFGHAFGGVIGSSPIDNSAFADVWGKLAAHYAGNSNVIFGLMNEPHDQTASQWLTSVNAAISAIRSAGATTQEVLVPGTYWDGASTWTTTDNAAMLGPGVNDPSNNYAFEVHQYLDSDGSGTHSTVVSPTIGVERLTAITQWAESTGHKLFLGEIGVASDTTSLEALSNTINYMEQHTDAWQAAVYWAGGPWWRDYAFSIEPQNGIDKPQMGILTDYVTHDGLIDPVTASAASLQSNFLWQNDNGAVAMWTMDGINVQSTLGVGVNPGTAWHIKDTADFNGDGKADILWQNNDGQPAIWFMDGTTVLSTPSVGVNPGTSWHIKGAADFNDDGKADILWQNDDGQAAIWTMDGAAVLSTPAVGPYPGPSWHIKGAADFNGDGKADILWQNDSGQAAIWIMNGTTVLSTPTVGGNPGPSWHVETAADFDGDGKADILWQNDNGQVAIWLMNGTNELSASAVGNSVDSHWHVEGASDLNGDGKADVLFQNDDGHVAVWTMDGINVLGTSVIGTSGPGWHLISHDLF